MASTYQTRICDLPDEVLLCIFSSLPVTDLARCAAQCERFHRIVTGFAQLWKGKEYSSNRSPTECAETRAVLHALPPLQEVTIKSINNSLFVSYPSLHLSDNYIGLMKDYQKLRCKSLSLPTTVPIAQDVLSFKSAIDLEGLEQLSVEEWLHYLWHPNCCSADSMVCTAMRLCPNLRSLSVHALSLTAESLDAVEEFSQLQTLEIHCNIFYKLSFLRHCSGTLQELQLFGCHELPSREFSELSLLQNLQRLWLSYCRFEEGDLAAAMAGLTNLESLRLDCCSVVRDLSILQHCGRLKELHISNLGELDDDVDVKHVRLQDLQLPTEQNSDREVIFELSVAGDDLSAALRILEEQGLNSSCLAYLRAICHCSQLRHLSFEFEIRCDALEMSNARIYITLTGST